MRKASLTVWLVMSPLFHRFSTRSLLVAPELRQAIVLKVCGDGRESGYGAFPGRLSWEGRGNAAKMRSTYLLSVATVEME